jgi:5-hydroxyisourate hydrolase
MSPITTHVLDVSNGQPASGIAVVLQKAEGAGWSDAGNGVTDAEGRIKDLLRKPQLAAGRWRLVFATGAYFAARRVATFFPEVTVEFLVGDAAARYHIPLLLSPFGYTTYRGS